MEPVGIQLIAQGGDAYLATLTASAAAEVRLGQAAETAVSGVNALDDSQARAGKASQAFAQMSDMAAANAAALGDGAEGAAGDVTALGKDAEAAFTQGCRRPRQPEQAEWR